MTFWNRFPRAINKLQKHLELCVVTDCWRKSAFIYSPRNMGKKYRGIRMSRIGKCGVILLRPRKVQRISCGWHLTECISMLSYYTGSFQDFQCVLYALWLHFCKIGCLQTSFQESTYKFSWYLPVLLFWVITFKPCWVLMRSFIIMIILILLLYQYLLRLIPILSPLLSLQLSKIMLELSFSILRISFQKHLGVLWYNKPALGSFW